MALRETENNAYAKFWGDKQRALWYVMVVSGVVNCSLLRSCFAPTRDAPLSVGWGGPLRDKNYCDGD